MDKHAVQLLLNRFHSLKILVIGDFMLDQYVWGRVDRISPEAPVPIVTVESESVSLGGAGNVAMNAKSLGASVIAAGVIGSDPSGGRVRELLEQSSIDAAALLTGDRPTTLKSRIIAHQQQVVRVDREEKSAVSEDLQAKLGEAFLKKMMYADGIIVSDYSKGTITPSLLSRILPEAKRAGKIVCLDPKIRNFSSYSPVTVITPNQNEAGSILGYAIQSDDDLQEAGRRILNLIDCRALLITRGDKGMALFADGKLTLVPTRAREVYDVTGAGDTVVTALCLALAAGADMLAAVEFSNLAAGIVVSKVGTATATPEELLALS